jgi:hypothetical protein
MNRPSKSARYHPQWLYSLALVLLLATAGLAVEESIAPNVLFQFLDGLRLPSRIKWRTDTEALAECERTHKTILYVMLPTDHPASPRFESIWLQEPEIAKLVNENFIPVRISAGTWSPGYETWRTFYSRAQQVEQTRVVDFKAFRWRSFDISEPFLALVAYDDLDQIDLNYSTSSLSEVGAEGNNPSVDEPINGLALHCGQYQEWIPGHIRPPFLTSCESQAHLVQFLEASRIWHRLRSSRGDVNWQCPGVISQPPGDKPRLIFFLERNESHSDSLRFDCFFSPTWCNLVNKNFAPVILEYDRAGASGNEAFDRWAKFYNVHREGGPVVILDRGDGQVAANYGYDEGSAGSLLATLEWWAHPERTVFNLQNH